MSHVPTPITATSFPQYQAVIRRLAALSIEGNATPHLKTIGSELGRQWPQIPLKARLTLPPRELQQLPIEVRPAALSGRSVDKTIGRMGLELGLTESCSGTIRRIEHSTRLQDKGSSALLAWQSRSTMNALAAIRPASTAEPAIDERQSRLLQHLCSVAASWALHR